MQPAVGDRSRITVGGRLLRFIRCLWRIYANPWVIVSAYWVMVFSYFGWHWMPESDTEMEAFAFGFLMFLVAAMRDKA